MPKRKKLLPAKTEHPSEWYTTVVKLADLADYGPVRGTMIIKPYGYALWERVQAEMNPLMQAKGVQNAYFPAFIPHSFLQKEASHVEGFSPELAVVTHAGDEELEEPLVVRPTSETTIYNAYANWVQSWRDLPLMMNQWCNVVRWEKRTQPFLRTSEFLWQEGHTAHASHSEAKAMQQWGIDLYAHIYRSIFAIDGYVGEKSTMERFAGANSTLTFEAMMPSGKALQAGTSHDLGQNFSKAFDISFSTKDDSTDYAWQTSWGLSTRSLGALILAHGDDDGLVLPPRIAPTQVAIITTAPQSDAQSAFAQQLLAQLTAANVRVIYDDRDDERFGFKLNKWEVKGVPLTIRLGDKEVESNLATIKARYGGEQRQFAVDDQFAIAVTTWLEEIQAAMLAGSVAAKEAATREAASYDEFTKLVQQHGGFIKVFWEDNPATEKQVKEATHATSRCRLPDSSEPGVDFVTGKPTKQQWLFAKSY